MRKKQIKTALIRAMLVTGLIILLIGCESAGAGGSGGSGSTCDDTGSYTVDWKFSGSYSDEVSVATAWVAKYFLQVERSKSWLVSKYEV